MSILTINVIAEASIPHLAERAVLRILAQSDGTNKQEVSENVLTSAHGIESVINDIQQQYSKRSSDGSIDEDQQPIAHWSKTSFTSSSYLPNQHNRDHPQPNERHFRAEISFDVRVRDFVALGDFTTRLSTLEHCEVQSVSWKLLDSTRTSHESRLRVMAAEDALSKAKDYCTALCLHQDHVRIVPHEITVENDSRFAGSHRTLQTARSSRTSGTLAFTPEECTMALSINAVFKIEVEGIVHKIAKSI